MPTITERALAATIDHAILKPELTRTDVDAELDIAAEWKVFSVCVRPSDIRTPWSDWRAAVSPSAP
jgi:deoxyribose-phosphate aldolase